MLPTEPTTPVKRPIDPNNAEAPVAPVAPPAAVSLASAAQPSVVIEAEHGKDLGVPKSDDASILGSLEGTATPPPAATPPPNANATEASHGSKLEGVTSKEASVPPPAHVSLESAAPSHAATEAEHSHEQGHNKKSARSDEGFTPITTPVESNPAAAHEEDQENSRVSGTDNYVNEDTRDDITEEEPDPSKGLTEPNNVTTPQQTQKDTVDGLPASMQEFSTQVSIASTPRHRSRSPNEKEQKDDEESATEKKDDEESAQQKQTDNKLNAIMIKIRKAAAEAGTQNPKVDINLDQSRNSLEDDHSRLDKSTDNEDQRGEDLDRSKNSDELEQSWNGSIVEQEEANENQEDEIVENSMQEEEEVSMRGKRRSSILGDTSELDDSMDATPIEPLELHPRSTLKKLKRVLPDDPEVTRKAQQEMEELRDLVRNLVKSDIKDRGCVLEAERAFLLSLNGKDLSEEQQREQADQHAILSTAIKEANEKMKDSLARERSAKDGQLKEQQKETANYLTEVCKMIRGSLDAIAVNERLIMIPVHKIDHWKLAREKDPRAVVRIQYELMSGIQKQRDMIVHVVRHGNRFILIDGVQRKSAYEELYELVKEAYPDDFENNVDDDEDACYYVPGGSQPAQGCSAAKLPRREASMPPPQKPTNPFAMIPALLIESAPKALEMEFCVEYRANRVTKGKKLDPIEHVAVLRRLSTGLYLSDTKATTAKKHEEELRKSQVDCSRASVRAIRYLPEECDNKLKALGKVHRELNTKTFINSYIAARKVSQVTADEVIANISNGKCEPEEGVAQLAEHSTRVSYLLIGMHVDSAVALDVEKKLQFGKRSYGRVRFYIRDKNRLDSNSILKKRHDPMLILKELERDLENCVAFTIANVYGRALNDGIGTRQCILNFIDYKDLTEEKMDVFRATIAMDKPCKFIVTQDGSENLVDELYNTHHIPSSEFYFDAMAIDKDGNAKMDGQNTIRAVVIEGRKGLLATSASIRESLQKFRIDNTITNQHLRHLMYDSVNTSVLDENKYNSIYVHSHTPQILCIVANLALNRIYTSLEGEEGKQFTLKLNRLQLAKTSVKGKEAIEMKLKLKQKVAPKRPADADSNDIPLQ